VTPAGSTASRSASRCASPADIRSAWSTTWTLCCGLRHGEELRIPDVPSLTGLLHHRRALCLAGTATVWVGGPQTSGKTSPSPAARGRHPRRNQWGGSLEGRGRATTVSGASAARTTYLLGGKPCRSTATDVMNGASLATYRSSAGLGQRSRSPAASPVPTLMSSRPATGRHHHRER